MNWSNINVSLIVVTDELIEYTRFFHKQRTFSTKPQYRHHIDNVLPKSVTIAIFYLCLRLNLFITIYVIYFSLPFSFLLIYNLIKTSTFVCLDIFVKSSVSGCCLVFGYFFFASFSLLLPVKCVYLFLSKSLSPCKNHLIKIRHQSL